MKKTFFLISTFLLLISCTSASPADTSKLSIYSSFYPLAFLAEQIAGDKAEVINVVPNGVEPHDFEPSSKTIAQITDSDLFLLNGAGLDAWANQFIDSLDSSHPTVINTSEFVELFKSGNTVDPHFWLDPTNLMKISDKINERLISIDPSNANFYETNHTNLQAKLMTLDSDFTAGLKTCDTKSFVTSHAAFQYLAKRYNLEMVSIAGISPDEEPSIKKIAEISSLVEQYGVKYVFSETLLSSKITETIANESKAQILVLNPIEGLTNDEEKTGEDYFSIMRLNLKNLKTALECR